MLIAGIIAQEETKQKPLPSYHDVVLQSDFEGAEGATTATDDSRYHNDLAFTGAALTTAWSEFGASSAKFDASTDAITARYIPAYDGIGQGDYTIEFFFRPGLFGLNYLLSGYMWDLEIVNGSNIQFRISADGVTWFNPIFVAHGMVAGGSGYHVALCKYKSWLRLFVGGVLLQKVFWPTIKTPGGGPEGIVIGNQWYVTGTVDSAEGTIDALRLTAGAWYRSDASFTPPSNPFTVPTALAPLHVDADIIRIPLVSCAGSLSALPFIDADTIYGATHTVPLQLLPQPVVDGTEIGLMPTFISSPGNAIGAFTEQFNVNTATPPLPTSRATRRLLVGVVCAWHVDEAIAITSAGWHLGAVSRAGPFTTAWGYRLVDGSETAPQFFWTTPTKAWSQVFQFANADSVYPIGERQHSTGHSQAINLPALQPQHLNSLIVGMLHTLADQVQLTPPPGYTQITQFCKATEADLRNSGSWQAYYEPAPGTAPASPVQLNLRQNDYWSSGLVELTSGVATLFYPPWVRGGPVWVNANTTTAYQAGPVNNTSATVMAFPANRVNGNLLIAQIQIKSASAIALDSTATANGWTLGASVNGNGVGSAWAWRYVDGDEITPIFSWPGGAVVFSAVMHQFTNVHPTTPIGTTSNTTGSGTTASLAGITPVSDLCSFWGVISVLGDSGTMATPSGFTLKHSFHTFNGSDLECLRGGSVAGVACPTLSMNISSSQGWSAHLIELRSPTALQATLQPLEYDDPDSFLAPSTVQPGTILAVLVDESEVIYGPTAGAQQGQLLPSYFSADASIYAPSVAVSAVTLTPSAIASDDSIATTSAASSNPLLPSFVAADEAFPAGRLDQVEFIGLVASDDVVQAPIVDSVGSVSLLPSPVSDSDSIPLPGVSVGPVTLTVGAIASDDAITAPTTVGFLIPGIVTDAESIPAPAASYSNPLTPSAIASDDAIATPVSTAIYTLTPGAVTDSESIAAPTITQTPAETLGIAIIDAGGAYYSDFSAHTEFTINYTI